MKIAVLPGDGIGPEVTNEAVRVLREVADSYGHDFEFTEHAVGGAGIKQSGTPLPEETLKACLASDSVLLGAVGSPEYDSLSPDQRPEVGLLNLRRELGAFANLRPTRCYPALGDCSPMRTEAVGNADILIVRELLGGLYFGEPRGFTNGVDSKSAINTMRYSTEEIERIAHIAFNAARTRRCKVTSVDKANVLETSQLWREIVSKVALGYPEVTLEHLYVDACAMHLAMQPRKFDVILTENLFGDILSDEAAAIAGSLGMLASASLGGKVDIYEPVHGSAPDLAGLGVANPFGAIASAALLLRYTAHLEQEAQDVEAAISTVLDAGYRTSDLDRGHSKYVVKTADIGALVIEAIAAAVDIRYAYHAV
ncbi:MAG TPA: 3-isopropylmalate dehydrogenase [Pyrinomonadaceae bacterium]|nr:3-isopropylmalate dehydrogenase [Pyrinomonadaceae bacterium]